MAYSVQRVAAEDVQLLRRLRSQLARRFSHRYVALTALVTTREFHESWRLRPDVFENTGWLGVRTLRTILSRRINREIDAGNQADWLGFWSDLLSADVIEVHEYRFVRTNQT